jgi:hypothetical protein
MSTQYCLTLKRKSNMGFELKTEMTAQELREFTTRNGFDTIEINGKAKSEYNARQYLFHLKDQDTVFKVKAENEKLILENGSKV